jgi:hypothetical protein
VQNKIEDRIQRAARKNPAFDENRYQELIGKLEYSDLRELQDIISAKATWDRFRERFVNKEALVTRFDQLAELRNGIRHSRTVDEITRKEGEAALLWFRQVLNK